MLSGVLDLADRTGTFDRLAPAHEAYVEIGTVETDRIKACLIVEKDTSKTSIAARYWGQTVSASEYDRLRQEMMDWSLQSVVIEQAKTTGHFELERNRQAECTLFAFPKGQTLYLHWDPVALYPHLDTSDLLDIKGTLAMLELVERYKERTAFKNLFRLPERAKAVFNEKGLTIIRPPHIDPPEAVPLKDGADPVAMFHTLVRKAAARWPADAEQACAILSSGLDTTIVAHMLCQITAPQKIHSFGYQGIDENREGIRAMRMETVERLNLEDHYPPVEEGFDQVYSPAAGKWWPEQTQCDFAERLLIKRMAAGGKTLAFTGVGGDELGMLTDSERGQPLPPLPRMFTLVSKRYLPEVPKQGELVWPNGFSAYSVTDMANSTSFLYLRQGIWVANPLASAEIQSFAKFLPREWRQERRISREALTRLGYSDFFTRQIPKEDFGPTMLTIMPRVDWHRMFARESVLCDLGVIDRERLFEGVDIFKKTLEPLVGIKLMTAIQLELALRSVHNHG